VADWWQAVKHLIGALRPGGWLLVEEPDFTFTSLPARSPEPIAR
jgi:hypothetical protein